MSLNIVLPYKYEPRGYQLPFFKAMDNGIKRIIVAWHRRAGKDKSFLNATIKKMQERVGIYYYFFPKASQGRKVLWNGIDKDGFPFMSHFPEELIKRKNNTEMIVETLNGSIFQIVGADNYNSIMGTNPIGLVFSEYSLNDPAAWDHFRPIVKENGGWAIFNFTPRGDNHAKKLFDMAMDNVRWFAQLLTVEDTFREDGKRIISDQDIEDEREEGMSEDMIEQEYFCSFEGAIDGSYYGKEMKALNKAGQLTNIPHETTLPVYTFWDLGMDDSMTIWFAQFVGKEIRLIDYYESSGEGFPHYAKILKEKSKEYGYMYEDHYMPHDVAVRDLSANGETRKVVAEKLMIKPIVVVPRVKAKEIAIEAVRTILPKCWIDVKKCKRGVEALKQRCKKWDDKNKVFLNKPAHDWTSHGCDALEQLARGFKEKTDEFKYNAHPKRTANGADWTAS